MAARMAEVSRPLRTRPRPTTVVDATNKRAGAAKWPDPPWGGGEEYLGLWRKDQVGSPPLLSSCSCVSRGRVRRHAREA